jgi:DNA-binding MurR/RpiR family transcriptional regulator
MTIKANQFVTGANERVLTDEGQQGMHGKSGIGSTTERHLGYVAAAIYENCAQLDNRQLDEIVEWIRLYKK